MDRVRPICDSVVFTQARTGLHPGDGIRARTALLYEFQAEYDIVNLRLPFQSNRSVETAPAAPGSRDLTGPDPNSNSLFCGAMALFQQLNVFSSL